MRIDISGSPPAFAQGLRPYAEYRAFVRLSPMADSVRSVRITIRRKAGGRTASCRIVADLGAAGSTQARGNAAEPIQAIDIAVLRLEDRIQRRLLSQPSSP